MSKSKGLESLLMDGVSGRNFSLSPSKGKHCEAFIVTMSASVAIMLLFWKVNGEVA